MGNRSVRLAAVVVGLLSSHTALADPIVVTSGQASIAVDGAFSGFQLFGNGLAITADSSGQAPQGLPAGATIVLSDGVSVTNYFQSQTQGRSATVNGTLYPHVWLSGGLRFVGAPFVTPVAPEGTFEFFNTTFVMNGNLSGYGDPSLQTPPLFAVSLTGSGDASTGPFRSLGSLWLATQGGGESYRFSAASPSPTPEPTTIVLLASGLIAAGARRFARSGAR